MIEAYNQKRELIIAADEVPKDKVYKYGVLDFVEANEELIQLRGFVEKPPVEKAPSNLINLGYAVLTPEIWKYLKNSESTSSDGEIRVADAYIKMLEDNKKIFAIKPDKPGYDCGSKIGFLKATVDMALQRDEVKDDFLQFLQTRI